MNRNVRLMLVLAVLACGLVLVMTITGFHGVPWPIWSIFGLLAVLFLSDWLWKAQR